MSFTIRYPYPQVNQFHLIQAEDRDTGLTYEVYLHLLPLLGGGQDMQAIVDPVSVEGGNLWKCWLREIETPRVDALRQEHLERRRAALPGEAVTEHLNLKEHLGDVTLDVLEAYQVFKVKPDLVTRVSRYNREPVI